MAAHPRLCIRWACLLNRFILWHCDSRLTLMNPYQRVSNAEIHEKIKR